MGLCFVIKSLIFPKLCIDPNKFEPFVLKSTIIWPYFFAWPFDKLTPQMKVELYRILTAGDVLDSVDFGGYIFYRVGIRPNGKWDFFVAGD